MNDRTRRFKALEFLCINNLAILSTHGSVYPESSVLYYFVGEKNSIFMITLKESRKVKNILNNNNVALVVFSEIPPLELQIEGKTERVEDPVKKNSIAKLYLEMAAKSPSAKNWPPVMKLPNTQGFEFIKVNVNKFKYSDFRNSPSTIVEGTSADWH